MTIPEHTHHVLLEIVCVCLLCFMFASCAFMEERECGCLVSPDLKDELVRFVILVLFFMMSCGMKVPIGELDCQRMISCCYLKEVVGFWKTKDSFVVKTWGFNE